MTHTEHVRGDRDGEFEEFVRSRRAPLHQSAYLLCGDWHLAHDVVQTTFVQAYRHWHRVQGTNNPDAYVRRILINEVRDRWRRRERSQPVANIPDRIASIDVAGGVTTRLELLHALLALPLRQRATIVLRYLEGYSERETAMTLNCSQGTVKSQTSRALATLRKFLNRTESML